MKKGICKKYASRPMYRHLKNIVQVKNRFAVALKSRRESIEVIEEGRSFQTRDAEAQKSFLDVYFRRSLGTFNLFDFAERRLERPEIRFTGKIKSLRYLGAKS